MVNIRMTRNSRRDALTARLAQINNIRSLPHYGRTATLQSMARTVLPADAQDDSRQGSFDFDFPAA